MKNESDEKTGVTENRDYSSRGNKDQTRDILGEEG